MRTGTLCVTLIKLPVTFSAGNNENLLLVAAQKLSILPVHFSSYTAVAVPAEMTLADVMQLGSDFCVLVRLVH